MFTVAGYINAKRVKGSGLAHIIKKDRLSTRYFAAIFRVVAAVGIGKEARTVW